MPRFVVVNFALLVIAIAIRGNAAVIIDPSEPTTLQDRLDDQEREIANLVGYSRHLKGILVEAGLPTGPPVEQLSLQQKMEQILPRAHCDHRRLIDAINGLERAADIRIVVDWVSLAPGNVTKNTPVSCDASGSSVGEALRAILDATGIRNMEVSLANGVVNVTTSEKAATHVLTRKYDVKGILQKFQGAPESMRDFTDAILRLITETVAADSWVDSGGSVGSISINGYQMTVTQTPANLAAIDDLLDQMEFDGADEYRLATIDQQESRILLLSHQIDELTARLRSAGMRVPPPLDRAMVLRLPEIRFAGLPFSECMKWISVASGQIINLNREAMAAGGIDPQMPIKITLSRQTLAGAMKLLLERANIGTVQLAYVSEDNVINVSTREDLTKKTITRVYDVRDLLATRGNRNKVVNALISDLVTTIDPEGWRDSGGNVGAIRELQGRLIVTQTESALGRIKVFLDSRRHRRKSL